jgi:hypothetical protein
LTKRKRTFCTTGFFRFNAVVLPTHPAAVGGFNRTVDEEIKELVFVNFIVCLLSVRHVFSKQTFPLTGFVRY